MNECYNLVSGFKETEFYYCTNERWFYKKNIMIYPRPYHISLVVLAKY